MKQRIIAGTVLALLIAAGIAVHHNRHEIALRMNTDPEVMASFESISIGDTLEEVTAKMGNPIGTLKAEAEETQYEKDTLYLKWPRHKGTTFAVRIVDNVVVEKYDRWGS